MEKELCYLCEKPTGRCGEDSIYDDNGTGPFCETCWEERVNGLASAQATTDSVQ
jgi:hypothetical protein